MEAKKKSKLRVLFIGNSYTAHNDLTDTIATLARSAGSQITTERITAGGASLRRHWNAGAAKRAIEKGKFDIVVLQEQSTLPIKNRTRFHENVRLFDEVIRAAGARTALYMTWARKNAPQSQAQLTEAYDAIGRELRATVVPVGRVWQKFLETHDQPVLHDKDGSHPTPAGSYLVACVFVRALLGRQAKLHAIDAAGVSAADESLIRTFVMKQRAV